MFFAAVKSFDVNIAISGNFVLNTKKTQITASHKYRKRSREMVKATGSQTTNLGSILCQVCEVFVNFILSNLSNETSMKNLVRHVFQAHNSLLKFVCVCVESVHCRSD